jgi:ubiquinone/menaquinone biosynthesis C-methylase UbiE
MPNDPKVFVRDHWEIEPCGTRCVSETKRSAYFEQIERDRYRWEPYIPPFAVFETGAGRKVLEVGVGAGTDFVNWVRHGAQAYGVDLTHEGVRLTRERLSLHGLTANVLQADAENLPFQSNSFDLVYSWGVLHHSPDTPRAIEEVRRVLKPGGRARIMVYHSKGAVGFMLWGIHCLARLRPWRSSRWAIYNYLESPGTKAYSVAEARALFSRFSAVTLRTQLSHADLLSMRPAEKYRTWYYKLAWNLYPRWLAKLGGDRFGTNMLIEARK